MQVAAYTAPGMFEHGTALTVQEENPAFTFIPICQAIWVEPPDANILHVVLWRKQKDPLSQVFSF
jgi:hypothetical protein